MDEAGAPRAEVDMFMHEAMADDYDHLLGTELGGGARIAARPAFFACS
jgi:hypothetical protein